MRGERAQHDHLNRACRPLPDERYAGTVDLSRNSEDIRRPRDVPSSRYLRPGRGRTRWLVAHFRKLQRRAADELADFCAGCFSRSERVSVGAPDRISSVVSGDTAGLSAKKPPATAPKTRTSPASNTVLRHPRRRGRAGRAVCSGCSTTLRGVLAVTGRGRDVDRSRGSGSSCRAVSASAGSTSASSGLIGPSSAPPARIAPSRGSASNLARRLSSGPTDIGTVLQAAQHAAAAWPGSAAAQNLRSLRDFPRRRRVDIRVPSTRCCKKPR